MTRWRVGRRARARRRCRIRRCVCRRSGWRAGARRSWRVGGRIGRCWSQGLAPIFKCATVASPIRRPRCAALVSGDGAVAGVNAINRRAAGEQRMSTRWAAIIDQRANLGVDAVGRGSGIEKTCVITGYTTATVGDDKLRHAVPHRWVIEDRVSERGCGVVGVEGTIIQPCQVVADGTVGHGGNAIKIGDASAVA